MTKAIKAQEMYKANPGITNADFVQLLMKDLGMSIAGARTYSYNVRNSISGVTKKATEAKVKPAKASAKTRAAKPSKAQRQAAMKVTVEVASDEIAAIKMANLNRMKTITEKLKPFRERMDDMIRERSPGFDPVLARLEIEEDEQGVLASEGLGARAEMFED